MAKKTEPALVGLRTHKGDLQTAVNTFKHPDGRTVTMVGIEHIGEADYYAELRKLVDKLHSQGAQVRYEMLLDKQNMDACRNDVEREGLRALNEQIETRFKMFETLGLDWIRQDASAMAPDPSWVISDVRAIDMVRMHGPAHIAGIAQLHGPKKMNAKFETLKENGSERALKMMRRLWVRKVCGRGAQAQKGKLHTNWWDVRVIYAWRETVEANNILAQDGDVVAVWGAPHLKGFSEALLRNQFELVDVCWHTAIHRKRS